MNEVIDERNEREEDNVLITEQPNDENPALFFRIPSPPSFNDGWSLN